MQEYILLPLPDVDYVSPLLTQVTYQGIIDDTFGIENGQFLCNITMINNSISKFYRYAPNVDIYRYMRIPLYAVGYLVLGPTSNIGKGSIKMLLNSSDQV